MGVFYALACAVFWAFAVVLLKHSVEKTNPLALNFFRVSFTFPLLALTALGAGFPLLPAAPGVEYIRLLASAILGIVIADTLFHQSLKLIGAAITAIVDTLYSPMTVLLAFLLLGERIGLRDYLGMALIVGGLLLSSTLDPPANRTRTQLIEGIGIGLLGIFFLALGIVVAKPALDHFPVLWVAAFRQGASAIVLLAVIGVSRRRRELLAVWRPTAAWKVVVPATLLGSYLSLTFWIAGMKYTLASIAAILTQSSTAFILVFSVVFLREPFTRRKVAAAALALAGVLLVTLR